VVYACAGGLDILNLTKTLLIYGVSYFKSGAMEFYLCLAITISLLMESVHFAFPICLHLVLNLNAGMIVAMFSLFPYIQC